MEKSEGTLFYPYQCKKQNFEDMNDIFNTLIISITLETIIRI